MLSARTRETRNDALNVSRYRAREYFKQVLECPVTQVRVRQKIR